MEEKHRFEELLPFMIRNIIRNVNIWIEILSFDWISFLSFHHSQCLIQYLVFKLKSLSRFCLFKLHC